MREQIFVWMDRLRHSAITFPLAVLVAVGMIGISEGSYRHARQTFGDLIQMSSARLLIYNIMTRTADAETAQRGFLLTGQREYLAPYDEAFSDIKIALKKLSVHYASRADAAAIALHKPLEEAVDTKFGELAETIKRQESGRSASALELMNSGLGRDQMNLIRTRSEELLHLELEHVLLGRAELFEALLLNRIGVATMTLVSLLALAMYLRQSRAMAAQRQAQALAIKAERDVLETLVQQRTEELTELASHLQTAREDERSRLARELHDELGALLTSAKLDAARMKPKLAPLDPDLLLRLSHLTDTLNSGIALKRRIIEDLRPSSLSNLGLLPSLEIQAREFSARLEVPVHVELEAVSLSPRADLTVYRLVQEAFTNIAKYAKATAISVRLKAEGAHARIEVSDNGIGFDPGVQPTSSHGLMGMRYRVESEGGSLSVRSSHGQGTVLSAVLPQQAPTAVAPVAAEAAPSA